MLMRSPERAHAPAYQGRLLRAALGGGETHLLLLFEAAVQDEFSALVDRLEGHVIDPDRSVSHAGLEKEKPESLRVGGAFHLDSAHGPPRLIGGHGGARDEFLVRIVKEMD